MNKLYLILGLGLALPLTAMADYTAGFSGGSGTASDPYKMSTVDDMYTLLCDVNGSHITYEGSYFVLTNDLDYAGTNILYNGLGIGTSITKFQGTFEGKGYRLKNISVTLNNTATSFGVFSYVGDKGTLKDFVVDSISVTANGNAYYCGTLASYNYGLIEDCRVTNATLNYYKSSTGNQNGGLVGYNDETGIIRNCSFSGSAYIYCKFGAIAGINNYALIDNCESDAVIIPAKAGTYYVGGLVGTTNGRGETGSVNVLNSTFKGVLSIASGSVTGTYLGGISGETSQAYIKGCVNEGQVVGLYYEGGIAGRAYNKTVIEDCRNVGLVADIMSAHDSTSTYTSTNVNFAGGIVGYAQSGPIVRSCANIGKVRGMRAVGGIVGGATDVSISDCYNAGLVDGPFIWTNGSTMEKCGGILGSKEGASTLHAVLTNCLSLGTVNNASAVRYADSEFVGYNTVEGAVTISNCYYDTKSAGWGSAVGPMSTIDLTSGKAIEGFDASTWTFTPGLYPRIASFASTDEGLAGAVPFFLSDASTRTRLIDNVTLGKADGQTWSVKGSETASIADGTLSVTRSDLPQNLELLSTVGKVTRTSLLTVFPNMVAGSGTQADPYLIASYADLKQVATLTNSGLDFRGEYLKLTADIEMGSDFPCFSLQSGTPFQGTFDADGHALKNWTLANHTNQVTYGGLFGYVGDNGVIKNLIIDSSCSIGLYRYNGTIAASLAGRIENCRVLPSSILTTSAAGEIGGIAWNVASTGVITDCYVGANIALTGSCPRVGGIASNNEGTIEGCQYAGTLAGTASSTIGGIAGQNKGLISDCLSSGNVTAQGIVGGIVGNNMAAGVIKHSLVTAIVTGGTSTATDVDKVGAVVGNNASTSFEDVVFDSQISIFANVKNDGITGKLTREIISDWKGDKWTTSGSTYPQLTKFADETMALQMSYPVIFVDGDTRINMTKNSLATLYQATGLTWKLDDGDDFTINTSKHTLKFDGDSGFCDDNLFQTYNGNKRYIKITALGTFLTGSGTEESPYLIASAANLTTLSTQANKTANLNDYAGMHFKVTADIALTSNFTPIAGGGFKKFRGIIHGDGHTISNLNISTTSSNGNTGLVGYLGEGGRIEDLTIASGSVVGAKANIGAFAGYVSDAAIVNCVNKADVTCTTSSVQYIGGVAGYVVNATAFEGNANYGAVTGSYFNVGGVAGLISGSTPVKNLVNYGDVKGTQQTGGVIGSISGCSADSLVNYGSVSPVSTGKVNIQGGVFGVIGVVPTVSNCRNYGLVSLGYTAIGGIAGRYYPQGATTNVVVISDCINAAKVSGTGTNIGGIVGQSETYPLSIVRCVNTDSIVNTAASVSASVGGAGGIMGCGNPTITDCWNAGTVIAANCVGGLLGRPNANGAVTITRSLNTGWIDGQLSASANIGSIAGYHSTAATYTDVIYDAQMSNVAAVGKADRDGITALSTSNIAVSDLALAKGDGAQAWTAEAGRYPIPTALAKEDAVVACSLPVFLADSDTRYAVTTDFNVATLEGAIWTADDPVKEDNGTVTVAAEAVDGLVSLTGDYNLTVSYGTYAHTYPLSFNYSRSATGIDALRASDASTATAVAGGILVGGNYRVVAVSGAIVAQGYAASPTLISLQKGVYVVVSEAGATKVVVR